MGKSRDSANLVADSNVFSDITNDRVGIGSTVPTTKLDVAGGSKFSGVVTSFGFSGNISGVAATFTGNVSIAGTLTFEDVTNVDSLGVITARNGVQISGGGGLNLTGGAGIITATTVIVTNEQATNINASGIGTLTNLRSTNISISGLSTFTNTVELDAGLRDFYGSVGAAGSVLTSTGAGVSWRKSSNFSAINFVLS